VQSLQPSSVRGLHRTSLWWQVAEAQAHTPAGREPTRTRHEPQRRGRALQQQPHRLARDLSAQVASDMAQTRAISTPSRNLQHASEEAWDDYALDDDYSHTDYGTWRKRSPEHARSRQTQATCSSDEPVRADNSLEHTDAANSNASGDQPLTAQLSREERRKRARS